MIWLGKTWLIASACVVCALLALAGTARGAGVAGYEEVQQSTSVPVGGSGDVTATCPSGDVVVGGGFNLSNQTAIALIASQPISTTTWDLMVQNGSRTPQTVTVTAVCVSSTVPGYEQKSSGAVSVPAASTNPGTADSIATCSAGKVVVGGGFVVSNAAVQPFHSEPVVNGNVVNNAWSTFVNSSSAKPETVTTTAICVSNSVSGYEQKLPSATIPVGTTSSITATCSAGNVVLGGGFRIETTPPTEFAVASEPASGGTLSATSWTTTVTNNDTSKPRGATSVAICATPMPPPAVTGIAPTQGPASGGNTVTITGSGFTGATAVSFGTTPATSFTVVSDTQITATAPSGTLGNVDVTVTGPGGTSATSAADHYTYTSAPVLTGLNPSFGPPAGGTVVTVSGLGFNGASAVRFGSVAASSFTVVSDTQITATAPPGTGIVDVTVTGPGGTSATGAADRYTYASPGAPVVTNQPPQVKSSSAAGFAGSVNPQTLPTTAHFEYFLDPKYGTVTVQSTPDQPVGSDVSSHPVSASVSGLVPNALYHVRLVAKNGAGTTQGPEQTFMTAKDPPPPAPVVGKSFNASTVSGLVLIKLPGKTAVDVSPRAASGTTTGPGYIPLTESRQLPIGTKVDARRGTMGLTAALTKRHKTQSGQFGGTIFLVSQTRRGVGVTTLTLLSGAFPGAPTRASCGKGKAPDGAPSAHAARYSQTLHASDRGHFRSSGHYAAATVRGTVWDTTDSCAGTLVVVHRGTVAVFDFVRHKTVILHAGQQYLARAH